MTCHKPSTTQPEQHGSLTKPMLAGGAIALILIAIFLLSAGESNPEWPKLWKIKLLVIVPLAGAMGSVFYYLIHHLSSIGLNKTIAV